mgnify:CR=1 FL=1|jgi:nitrite reductase/ring-hydroxylating ferredoxin subunit|tara:strand:- start:1602 stop:1919 length:318 start_codon:yes stop_codon:yes gene_type:complete
MNRKKIGTIKDLGKHNQFSRWVDGHDVLVYKFNGKICGMSNICPHFGGPVGYHEIKYNNGKPVFTCLWHNLQFDIETGECVTRKEFNLRKYKIDVDNEKIFVHIN